MVLERRPSGCLDAVSSRDKVPREEASKILYSSVDLQAVNTSQDECLTHTRTLSLPTVVPRTLRVCDAVGWRMTWDAMVVMVFVKKQESLSAFHDLRRTLPRLSRGAGARIDADPEPLPLSMRSRQTFVPVQTICVAEGYRAEIGCNARRV